jgi:hypothetical protein
MVFCREVRLRHQNDGHCAECNVIFDRYPGFYDGLRKWFFARQAEHPELHISDAGRGKALQEKYFKGGESNAHWEHSAHNWNAAIDMWVQIVLGVVSYPEAWFDKNILPKIPGWLSWYGDPAIRKMRPAERTAVGKFYELPHIEMLAWKAMAKSGMLKLVENPDANS